MTTEIATRAGDPVLTPQFVVSREAWGFAGALAQAEATPKAYRGKQADVFLIMQAAVAIDVPVFAALSGINVVEGKAEAGAELMLALLHRAGHRVRHGGSRSSAWCEITRADDPEYTYRETFDLDDAEQAGLCKIRDRERGLVTARSQRGTPLPWETHTRTMLRWRAISQAASYAAPETLMGVKYTPGEVGGPISLGDLAAADVTYSVTEQNGDEIAADAPTVVEQQPDTAEQVIEAHVLDEDADDWESQWRTELTAARNGRSLTNDLLTIAELGQTAVRLERFDLKDEATAAWSERTARGSDDPAGR